MSQSAKAPPTLTKNINTDNFLLLLEGVMCLMMRTTMAKKNTKIIPLAYDKLILKEKTLPRFIYTRTEFSRNYK